MLTVLGSVIARTFVLALFAVGAVLPSPSSAQTPASVPSGCRPLLVPEKLSSEIEDVGVPGAICPGQRLKVETEESRTRVEDAGVKVKEDAEEVDVRRPRTAPVDAAPPQFVDVDALEDLGYKTEREESHVVYETPTSRYEKHEEETEIKGEGFKYSSEESEEEVEEPGFSSEEEHSEESFEAKG